MKNILKVTSIAAIVILLSLGSLNLYLNYLERQSDAKSDYEEKITDYIVLILNAVYEIETLAEGDLTQDNLNRISELHDIVVLNSQKGLVLNKPKAVDKEIHDIYISVFQKFNNGGRLVLRGLESMDHDSIKEGLKMFDDANKMFMSGSERLFGITAINSRFF